MKIYIHEEYDKFMHGNQNYLLLLASNLDVKIYISLPSKSALYTELKNLKCKNIKLLSLNSLSYSKRSIKLISLVRKIKPDIILSNNEKSLISVSMASLLNSVPVIWYIKNMYSSFLSDLYCSLISRKILFISSQGSRYKSRIIVKLFKKKFGLLRIGVQSDNFVVLPTSTSYKKNKILMLSSISYNKGVDVAINAIEALDLRNEKFTLTIAGGINKKNIDFYNEMMSKVKDLKHCKVNFIGWTGDIPKLFKINDIYILPSRKEGVPRSVVESMMSSTPVIASEIGGIPSLITHKKTGFLIESGDHHALAKYLFELSNNSTLYDQLVSTAKTKSIKEFQFKKHIDCLNIVIKEVINDK